MSQTVLYEEFANRLKDLVEQSSAWTYSIADDLKVSPTLVSKWLNGEVLPTDQQCESLAKLLGCEANYLKLQIPSAEFAGKIKNCPISMDEFSVISGVSRAKLYEYRKGLRMPAAAIVAKIEQALPVAHAKAAAQAKTAAKQTKTPSRSSGSRSEFHYRQSRSRKPARRIVQPAFREASFAKTRSDGLPDEEIREAVDAAKRLTNSAAMQAYLAESRPLKLAATSLSPREACIRYIREWRAMRRAALQRMAGSAGQPANG